MHKRKPQQGQKGARTRVPLPADMIQNAGDFMIHGPGSKGNALRSSAGACFRLLGSVRQ